MTAETGGTSWAAHKCSFYSFFRSARLELDQLVVAQAPKAGHLDYTLRQIFKSTFNILVFWKFFLTILKNCSEIYLSNLIFFIFIWSRVGKYMTNIYIEIYCSYALWRDNQLDLWYGILKYIYRAYSLKMIGKIYMREMDVCVNVRCGGLSHKAHSIVICLSTGQFILDYDARHPLSTAGWQ